MRVEVVAIGTELLLGYVIDTNSAWMGEQLAGSGIDCLMAVKVGDNRSRIAEAIRLAVGRSDAVICCGGLGPTQDDITREAIAEVLGVPLVRDRAVEAALEARFAAAERMMPENNRRQADVPVGATVIEALIGSAPGLICSHDAGTIYAVPGVPAEMREMITRAVIPDLVRRSGRRALIASRTLKTCGVGESRVAEILAPRLDALDEVGNPAIAFLASAQEGVKVRITAKVVADDGVAEANVDLGKAAAELLAGEESQIRSLLGDRVYAADEESMEAVIGEALLARGLTVSVAESLTGGLIGARLTQVAGASGWFRGGVLAYASAVKVDVLGVSPGPVVAASAAEEMASGVARLTGSEVGLAVSGVAGPSQQEGQPVGSVWIGSWLADQSASEHVRLGGSRDSIRAQTVLAALDHLRRRLLGLPQRGWLEN